VTQSPLADTQPTVPVALAATHYDPEGRMAEQITRILPALTRVFGGLAIQAAYASQPGTLDRLRAAGALVRQEAVPEFNGLPSLGGARRSALELALQLDTQHILFCDFDRVLHWAEYHPDELARVVAAIAAHDFTVLGRTARAFASHPRIQRDTEAIINHVYSLASGSTWDVTAAARGISRRAAAAILDGCPDQTIGTDVSWPLFLQRADGFALGYIATEGLEFETADRFGDQIEQAGGLANWIAQLDRSPQQWAFRLELARIEVESAVPYLRGTHA
jgi:hypothetical protein